MFLKKKDKGGRIIGCFIVGEDGFMQVGVEKWGWACMQEGQEIKRWGSGGDQVFL